MRHKNIIIRQLYKYVVCGEGSPGVQSQCSKINSIEENLFDKTILLSTLKTIFLANLFKLSFDILQSTYFKW